MTIRVSLNSEWRELRASCSVADALQEWGYACEEIAVAVNGDFVPRTAYAMRRLEHSDRVDVVSPVQGG